MTLDDRFEVEKLYEGLRQKRIRGIDQQLLDRYADEKDQQNDALVTQLIRRDIDLFETRVAYEQMQRRYELALVAALLWAAWGWFFVLIR